MRAFDDHEDDDLPELPPVEELVPIAVPIVQQSASPIPDPHDDPEYLPFDRGLSPEAMCEAWARATVAAEGLGAGPFVRAVAPAKVRSQLDGLITVSRHLACLSGEVERPPTHDEQVASVVEGTAGFLDTEKGLRQRFVMGEEADVSAFLARLALDWPHGFRPDAYERLTRAEQVRQTEEAVRMMEGRARMR